MELCAADIRLRGAGDRAWRSPLEAPSADSASWPSLAVALAELARSLGITEGTLAVSLMPPLTEVRRLDLPPLPAVELQRLLSRNASRYFAGARGPQIVGARPATRRTRGMPTPVIAAVASARIVASIRNAAQQSGWTVEAIGPAESAWAAAALTLWPAFGRQNAWAAIAHDDRTDLLQIESSQLVGVRRFRAGALDAAMIADALGPAARVGVTGAVGARRELASALASHGVIAATATGDWATSADRVDVLAAHFAGSDAGPTLRGEESVALDTARIRKNAWSMLGAAAALLVVSALIELWGVNRQLRLVQEERARLKPLIASTMVGRTSVEATYRQLTALGAVERTSPRWAGVLTTLSRAVPDDAHLTAVRAREDSLIVDGLADHAARVFDALVKSNALIDVKAAAPVRRELQDNGTALDHFTISARTLRPQPRGGQ
jgi:hypothetical protein